MNYPFKIYPSYAIMMLFLSVAVNLKGQICALNSLYGEQILIQSETTINLQLKVSDALFNELSDPFQGVCSVRLDFNHERVSDLIMTLVSPSGERITLIGPADKSGTVNVPIFGVDHTISFVPSTSLTFPDPGFPDVWSNQNVNWGPSGPYNGVYHPFDGDFLVEMDTGSVNGIWELIIEDVFINDEGFLNSFQIEFCDQNLTCNQCEARSGIMHLPTVGICEFEILEFDSLYNSANFDTSLYADEFLIYNNQDFAALTNPSFSSADLPPGEYTVYGINILKDDIDSFATFIPSISQMEMLELFDQPGGYFCFDRSDSLILNVNSPGDTIRVSKVLCTGDFEILFGDTLRTSGVFVRVNAACDSVLELTLNTSDLSLEVTNPTQFIDCTNGSIELNADITSSSAVNYYWTNTDSTIVSTDERLVTTDTGQYILIVDDLVCSDTATFRVFNPRDTMSMLIERDSDQLNCQDTSVNLLALPNFEAESYEWILNDSILSTADTLSTNESGTFFIRVTAFNGCAIIDSVEVITDFAIPQLDLQIDSFNCTTEQVIVQPVTPQIINYEWFDNDQNSLAVDDVFLTNVPGDFSVIATGENFCDTTISFNIPVDTIPVRITNVPDSGRLTCSVERYEIDADIIAAGNTTSFWTFNNAVVQQGENIAITTPGTYQIVAIGENQCSDTVEVVIEIDTVSPQVLVVGNDISCLEPQVILGAQSPDDNAIFAWSNNVDTVLTMTSAVVSIPGIYTVGILDTLNECFSSDSILIRQNDDLPFIDLVGDTVLNCLRTQTTITDLSNETTRGEWYTPANDTIFSKTLNITEAGIYRYRGFGLNGCPATTLISILEDIESPAIDLPPEIFLNCSNPTTTLNIPQNMDLARIDWAQNGITFSGNEFLVASGDSILVSLTGTNGCINSQLIGVNIDQVDPQVVLSADTLNCNNPTVDISIASTSDRWTYSWTGNVLNGQGTSTIQTNTAGLFQLEVLDTINGCVNSETITITEDFSTPTFDTLTITRFLRCDFEVGSIRINPLNGAFAVFTDPDSMEIISNEIQVTEGGDYGIRLVGRNGCTVDRTETVLDTRTPIDFSIETDYQLNCVQPTALLQPSQRGSDVEYVWIYENGDSIMAIQQNISDASLQAIYAIDSTGCDTLIAFDILLDTITPTAEIVAPELLSCDGSALNIFSAEQNLLNYALVWNGPGTSLIDLAQLDVGISGTYNLLVVDRNNGCSATDSVVLNIAADPLSGISVLLEHESCIGVNDGMIEITGVDGGEGSVTGFINGELSPTLELENLSPGSYLIEVVDEINCNYDSTVVILEGNDYTIDLGPDITINRGDNLVLFPQYAGDMPANTDYFNVDGIINSNVDSLFFNPVLSQIIYASSQSINGCIANDSINVDIFTDLDQIQLYVPDILALNTSNGNELLRIELTDDIQSISNFAIYDRWGQQVFLLEDLIQGETDVVWDGTFNGRLLESGVYVYSYEIVTNIESRSKIVAGDITIIR